MLKNIITTQIVSFYTPYDLVSVLPQYESIILNPEFIDEDDCYINGDGDILEAFQELNEVISASVTWDEKWEQFVLTLVTYDPSEYKIKVVAAANGNVL